MNRTCFACREPLRTGAVWGRAHVACLERLLDSRPGARYVAGSLGTR